jgi:hypothetical protein
MTKLISKWMLIRLFVLTVIVFFLLAEDNRGGGDHNRSEIASKEARHLNQAASNSEANVTLPKNPGVLKLRYKERKSFRGSAAKLAVLVSQRAVYGIVGELKKQIALPFDIQVVFEECGDPDSYYDEDTREITICYELVDAYYFLFSRTLKARTARNDATKGATVSMFLHEVAHALIDGWDLPITGREEDAADQFSTLLLINGLPDGDEMALKSARSFRLLADLEKGQEKDYSDPHSFDEQRFFNTICLVYGHNPEKYEYLIKNGTLPARRAAQCEGDYARLNKSWQTLLAPHLVSRTAQFDTLGLVEALGYSSRIP